MLACVDRTFFTLDRIIPRKNLPISENAIQLSIYGACPKTTSQTLGDANKISGGIGENGSDWAATPDVVTQHPRIKAFGQNKISHNVVGNRFVSGYA
jgi:hypothetical protein